MVILTIIVMIMLTVSADLVALFFPKTVIAQIGQGVSVSKFVSTICLFTITMAVLAALKTYVGGTAGPKRMRIRLGLTEEILYKTNTTDYANLEKKTFHECRQKVVQMTNMLLLVTGCGISIK